MNNFKKGDIIKCIYNEASGHVLKKDEIYKVSSAKDYYGVPRLYLEGIDNGIEGWDICRFENISQRVGDALCGITVPLDDLRVCCAPTPQNNPSGSAKPATLPRKYIINHDATILFWNDNDKTIVKRASDDFYDKRLGFLYAYFQKTSGLSRNKANKYLHDLLDEDDLNALKNGSC